MASQLERLRADWPNHVGLLSSGTLFLLVAVRILAVAHFDLTTAAAVLQRNGTSSVLLGAVLATLPSLIAASVPVLTAVVALSSKTTFRAAPVRTGLTALVSFLWLVLVPIIIAAPVGLAMIGTSALYVTLQRRAARSPERLAAEEGMRPGAIDDDGTILSVSQRDARLVDTLGEQGDVLSSDAKALQDQVEVATAEMADLKVATAGFAAEARDEDLRPNAGGSAILESPEGELARISQRIHEQEVAITRLMALLSEVEARSESLQAERANVLARVERRVQAHRVWREKSARLTKRNTGVVVGAMMLMVLVILGSSLTVPWLPTERISADDTEAFTAYVLDESEDSLVVLRASDRAVILIPTDEKPRRTLCVVKAEGWKQSLLSDLRPEAYPTCPSD